MSSEKPYLQLTHWIFWDRLSSPQFLKAKTLACETSEPACFTESKAVTSCDKSSDTSDTSVAQKRKKRGAATPRWVKELLSERNRSADTNELICQNCNCTPMHQWCIAHQCTICAMVPRLVSSFWATAPLPCRQRGNLFRIFFRCHLFVSFTSPHLHILKTYLVHLHLKLVPGTHSHSPGTWYLVHTLTSHAGFHPLLPLPLYQCYLWQTFLDMEPRIYQFLQEKLNHLLTFRGNAIASNDKIDEKPLIKSSPFFSPPSPSCQLFGR